MRGVVCAFVLHWAITMPSVIPLSLAASCPCTAPVSLVISYLPLFLLSLALGCTRLNSTLVFSSLFSSSHGAHGLLNSVCLVHVLSVTHDPGTNASK